jgi:hypothetical protein
MKSALLTLRKETEMSSLCIKKTSIFAHIGQNISVSDILVLFLLSPHHLPGATLMFSLYTPARQPPPSSEEMPCRVSLPYSRSDARHQA